MPGTIILQKNAANHLVSGQSVQKGDKLEFDVITERWYFGAGIPVSYEANGTAKPIGQTGGKWVCLGPSDVESLPGGSEISTITWKGLFNTTTQIVESEAATVRETSWSDLKGIPGQPAANPHPAVTRDMSIGKTIKTLGVTSSNMPNPGYAAGTGKVTYSNVTGYTLNDIPASSLITVNTGADHKTYNVPWGWIIYSWQEEEPLPGFYMVSAEYKYIPYITFG